LNNYKIEVTKVTGEKICVLNDDLVNFKSEIYNNFSNIFEDKLKDIDKKLFFEVNKNDINTSNKLDEINNKIIEIDKNNKIMLEVLDENQKINKNEIKEYTSDKITILNEALLSKI